VRLSYIYVVDDGVSGANNRRDSGVAGAGGAGASSPAAAPPQAGTLLGVIGKRRLLETLKVPISFLT